MTAADLSDPTGISRRVVLAVGAAGASAVALAACSSSKSSDNAGSATTTTPSSASPEASTSSSGGAALAKLSDVAVGQAIAAKTADGKPLIITHPTATTVVAFSAICTHMGCTVKPTFHCPCHGSVYDPTTGARISGPAPSGLTKVNVAISGDSIVSA